MLQSRDERGVRQVPAFGDERPLESCFETRAPESGSETMYFGAPYQSASSWCPNALPLVLAMSADRAAALRWSVMMSRGRTGYLPAPTTW